MVGKAVKRTPGLLISSVAGRAYPGPRRATAGKRRQFGELAVVDCNVPMYLYLLSGKRLETDSQLKTDLILARRRGLDRRATHDGSEKGGCGLLGCSAAIGQWSSGSSSGGSCYHWW